MNNDAEIVATGTWLYDRQVPRPISVLRKPAKWAHSRYDWERLIGGTKAGQSRTRSTAFFTTAPWANLANTSRSTMRRHGRTPSRGGRLTGPVSLNDTVSEISVVKMSEQSARPIPVSDKAAALALTPVSRETEARLDRYVELLREWQAKTNLVAPSTLAQLWTRHIADSLQVSAAIPEARIWADLGSGGGIDVLLSARRVGPTGKAYGLDMTDEMLALANENKRKAGAENVEFLKGEIERIPLPDNSVDVIISNCVINLSADKDRVLREAFRVLKPGGRFAVSDVVTRGEINSEIRQSVLLWVGCIAGALAEDEYHTKLAAAGFMQIEMEPTRIYRVEDAREFLAEAGVDVDTIAPQVDGKFMSAFVRAVKPLSGGKD